MLLEQELRQHAHARAYFENGQVYIIVEGGGNACRHVQVGQEVLPEGFFGFYCTHFRFVSEAAGLFFVILECKYTH